MANPIRILNALKLYNIFNFSKNYRQAFILPNRTVKSNPQQESIDYETSDKAIEETFLKDFTLHTDFITSQEEDSLLNELEPYLKRLRYENSHWDDAIHNYRETEKSTWKCNNAEIIERMHQAAFGPVEKRDEKVMRFSHVLDLAETGYIKPHVDSIKFCGGVIGGLSLLSQCVMRFGLEQNPQNQWVVVRLPRRSLYVMRGDIRNLFSHEVLSNETSIIRGTPVPKSRRITVMCRCEPAAQAADTVPLITGVLDTSATVPSESL